MRTAACLVVALPLACSAATAAPVANPPDQAKEKLEALRKKLPEVLATCSKARGNDLTSEHDWDYKYTPQVRLVRRVGGDRAKAVVLFAAMFNGKRDVDGDVLLTVFLKYHDGCWTAEQFEDAGHRDPARSLSAFAFLMLAMDEAAGE